MVLRRPAGSPPTHTKKKAPWPRTRGSSGPVGRHATTRVLVTVPLGAVPVVRRKRRTTVNLTPITCGKGKICGPARRGVNVQPSRQLMSVTM